MSLLSIVVPAFNEEVLLPACIESIHREIEPWGIAYEIIVVDDNSTDNTAQLATDLGCIVVQGLHKGITRARQTGFIASKGDLVAFIDADNQLPPGWLVLMLARMHDPSVAAISGPYRYRDMNTFKRAIVWMFYTVGSLVHHATPMLQGGNFVLRKDALEKVGGFDLDVEFWGEDTTTAVRLAQAGKIIFERKLWIWSSDRRMRVEGLILTGARYMINFIWVHLVGHPWSQDYKDIRL